MTRTVLVAAAIAALTLAAPANAGSKLTFRQAHKAVAVWKQTIRELDSSRDWRFTNRGCKRRSVRRIDCLVTVQTGRYGTPCGNRLIVRKSRAGKVRLVRRNAPPQLGCGLG